MTKVVIWEDEKRPGTYFVGDKKGLTYGVFDNFEDAKKLQQSIQNRQKEINQKKPTRRH